MRVLINTSCALRTRAGVGHHVRELTAALRGQPGVATGEYPSGWLAGYFRFFLRQVEACERFLERPEAASPARRLVRRAVPAVLRRGYAWLPGTSLAHFARRGGYQLYHEPNAIPEPCGLPTVVTIHDLSVLLHPEWHPPRRVQEYTWHFERGLKRACHLLAVSEFTRREVVRHLGWKAEDVTVTPNGRRPDLRPLSVEECAPHLQELGLAPGYLLHVGTLEPRKNLRMLMGAYCTLPADLRERHPLVLVGGPGWNAQEINAFLHDEARHRNVRWLGYVPDSAFAALYSSARALVFPTRYEGFGLPTVEMMACGGAVLASTAGAVAETVGGQAHLIDPDDADGWRDAMHRVCTDDDWWRSLRAGAEATARPFTWQRCAADTVAGYRRALGRAA